MSRRSRRLMLLADVDRRRRARAEAAAAIERAEPCPSCDAPADPFALIASEHDHDRQCPAAAATGARP